MRRGEGNPRRRAGFATVAGVTLALVLAVGLGFLAPKPAQEPKPKPEIAALLDQAFQAGKAGRREDGLRLYEEALSKARALGDTSGCAQALKGSASLFDAAGNRTEACRRYEEAIPLFRQVGDTLGEAWTLRDLSITRFLGGQRKEAVAAAEGALSLFRKAGERSGEARIQFDLGQQIEEPAKAREHLEAAGLVFRELDDKPSQAKVLLVLGSSWQASNLDRAVDCLEEALGLAQQVKDAALQAEALYRLGGTDRRVGNAKTALGRYEQCLKLRESIGDKAGQAVVLTSMGVVCSDLGDHDRSLALAQRAAPLFAEVGNKSGQAQAIHNVGFEYRVMRRVAAASRCFEQALALWKEAGDLRGQARALRQLGSVTDDAGQPDRAIEYLKQGREFARLAGDEVGEGDLLADIGDVLNYRGRVAEAVAYFRQAHEIYARTGEREKDAQLLGEMGHALVTQGKVDEGFGMLKSALPLLEGEAYTLERANLLVRLGQAAHHVGRLDEAEAALRPAAELLGQWGDHLGRVSVLTRLANVLIALGRKADAEEAFREAIRTGDAIRASAGPEVNSGRFLPEGTASPHFGLVALLADLKRPADAFAAAQAVKGRTLLSLAGEPKVDLSKYLTQTQADQERALRQRASDLAQQLTELGTERGGGAKAAEEKLKNDAAEAERKLQWFYDDLYARHPVLSHKRPAKAASLAEVGKLLPTDTVLLEYSFLCYGLEEGSLHRTMLFVVTSAGGAPKVSSHEISMTHDDLKKAVQELRESCADRWGPWRSRASALYKKLLAPAAKELAGKKRLIVCPDGHLWDVPFQVLVDDTGKCLVERFELDYAYSASAVQTMLAVQAARAGPKPREGPLVVANPDFGAKAPASDSQKRVAEKMVPRGAKLIPLPGTQREADAIRRLYPGSPALTGASAQEASVKKRAGEYRYLHFATHGFVNDVAPMLSSLALARPSKGSPEDGFLSAMEISAMDLPAELAVLSACNTAGGEVRKGEGMVGLSWALHLAGVRSQVLSMWAVNDASTATLIEGFYARLKKGQPKGQALREASLALMRDGKHAHPYFWAPFVLLGDWR